jgi:hypothetical protein
MGLKDVRLNMETLEKREVPAIIVHQPYDGASLGYVAQDFADFASFSSYEFDDFSSAKKYKSVKARAYGTEFGSAAANISVHAEIKVGADFNSATVIASSVGKENATNGDITFAFKGILPVGSFWFTAWVERSFGTGGQWFWHSTQPVTGSESFFHNPGGGFGYGTAPIPGSAIFGVPANMAMTIVGKVTKSDSTAFDFQLDTGDDELGVIQTTETRNDDVRVGITAQSDTNDVGDVQDGRILAKGRLGNDLGDELAAKWGNVV